MSALRLALCLLPLTLLCALSALPLLVHGQFHQAPTLLVSSLRPVPLVRYTLSACPLRPWVPGPTPSANLTYVRYLFRSQLLNSSCAPVWLASAGQLSSVGAIALYGGQQVNLTHAPLNYSGFSLSVLLSVPTTATPGTQSLFGSVADNVSSGFHALQLQGNKLFCSFPSYGSAQQLALGYIVANSSYHAGCVYNDTSQQASGFLRSFDPRTGYQTNVNSVPPVNIAAPVAAGAFSNSSLQLGPTYTGLLADPMLWPYPLPVAQLLSLYVDLRVGRVNTVQPLPNTVGPAPGFAAASYPAGLASRLFHTPGVQCGGASTGRVQPLPPLQQAAYTPATMTATVTVSAPAVPGMRFNSRLLGLSFEADQRGIFTAAACPMQSLFSMLGPGLLRLGGGSLNQLDGFLNTTSVHGSPNFMQPNDFALLAGFLPPTGWQLILGLPVFQQPPLANITAAAVFASRILGSSLYALQLANEPDQVFNASAYAALSQRYWAPIRAAVPKSVLLSATDATDNVQPTTGVPYTAAVLNLTAGYTSMLSVHFYNQFKSCGISPWTLFAPSGPAAIFGPLQSLAQSSGRVARITEAGSWSSKGIAGVSNSFASAYWLLQFAAQLAAYNISGANLHGGLQGGWYAPIVNGGYNPNVTAVNAQYYAMLLLNTASYGGGSFVNAAIAGNSPATLPAGVTAQCIQTSSSYNVILANANSQASLNVTLVTPLPAVLPILVTYLNAPGIASTSGFTWGGAAINGTGVLAPQSFVLQSGSTVVYLPPLTIALAQVQYREV